MGTGEFNAGGNSAIDLHPIQGGRGGGGGGGGGGSRNIPSHFILRKLTEISSGVVSY